jgi:CTP:molybdopterin cytidylyltransferase MocA
MLTEPRDPSVYAIVLAAGSAKRFGSSKQLAEWNGEALVRRAARLAMQSCGARTLLVVGHNWQAVHSACLPLSGCFVINNQHATGIGSSLALAVSSIRHAAKAIVVLLADQPLVTTQHIAALIDKWSGDPLQIVATAYANTSGVPALFASGTFDKLGALCGDQGARKLLVDPEFDVREIEFAAAATDIDTVADLSSLPRNAHS